MSKRGRTLAMSFPIGEDTLYVYAEPDADYKELPTKIIETIQSWNFNEIFSPKWSDLSASSCV